MARRSTREGRPFASLEKIARARELRREMTPAEERLWQMLRRKALGVRARPQHVILGWIVDFYLAAQRAVIEVDGDVHDLQAEEDARRTDALEAEGVRVFRVRNEEVESDLPAVLHRIELFIGRR